jgi:hypothetical protein
VQEQISSTVRSPMLSRLLYPDFPPEDEALFLSAHNDSSISTIRMLGLIGGLVFMAYSFADLAADPINGKTTAFIRCAVGLLLLAASKVSSRILQVHYQEIAVFCLSLVAVALVVIAVLLPNMRNGAGSILVIPTFLLLLSFNFGFLRLLFLPASISGVALILSFNVLSLYIDNPVLLKSNLHMLTAFLIGAWVSYQLERLFRKQFVSDMINNRLLSQIYPGQILGRIKNGERFIADESSATVVFIDILGFTAIARTLSVVELIQMLNDIFSIFDHLALKHGIEKIKTIGDAYMAVSGAGITAADDLPSVLDFSLGAMQAVTDYAGKSEIPVQIRIGIHTGPVISGTLEIQSAFSMFGERL